MHQRIDTKTALMLCASALPALLVGLLIVKFGVDVPYWDQWAVAPFFVKLSRGTLTAADLFAQQYEYRQFFPQLIFVALGWLTRWDVRYEMLFSLALACLTSLCVYRLGKATLVGHRASLLLISNLLIFSTIQYMNWLSGIQIIYFMPVACLACGLLVAISRLETSIKFLLCMSLAAVSTFSSANGILCWVLLPPVLWWVDAPRAASSRKNSLWALWAAGFVVCCVLYFYGYRSPSGLPSTSESLLHPARAIAYYISLLGAPLAVGRISASILTGATLVILYALAWISFLRRLSDRQASTGMLVWLMVGGYSIGTCALITVGRVGYGVEHSLSSRYTTFSLYLIVALAHLLVLNLEARAEAEDFARGFPARRRLTGRTMLRTLAAALVIVQLLTAYAVFHQASIVRRERLRLKACLLLINVVESDCLKDESWPDTDVLRRTANELNDMGFLRPPLLRSARIGDIAGAPGQNAGGFGSLDNLYRLDETYIVSGRAVLPQRGEPADAVLLVYENNVGELSVFALSDMKPTGDVTTGPDGGTIKNDARWEAAFPIDKLPPDAINVTAWAFDAGTGKAYRLDGSHALQRHE
ncbi:MAG: hypothetical protein WCD76_00720 [Pyrinomonadaceae bacterium]